MGSNENIDTPDLVKVGERTGQEVSVENLSDEKRKYEVLFEEVAQFQKYSLELQINEI